MSRFIEHHNHPLTFYNADMIGKITIKYIDSADPTKPVGGRLTMYSSAYPHPIIETFDTLEEAYSRMRFIAGLKL